MKKLFSKFLGFLKYLLLFVSFVLVFYGILVTYKRLEKPITDAIGVFMPFILLFVVYIINLFSKSKLVRNNLFYNFIAVLVFCAIIVVGLRAKFDTNLMLYHKYGINFNPAYFSDNLAAVEMMLYTLAGSNILFLLAGVFTDKDVKKEKAIKDEK